MRTYFKIKLTYDQRSYDILYHIRSPQVYVFIFLNKKEGSYWLESKYNKPSEEGLLYFITLRTRVVGWLEPIILFFFLKKIISCSNKNICTRT